VKRAVLAAAFLLAAAPACAQVAIEKPWARATAPGAKVAGGYMVIRNNGHAADRLVAASSEVSARVEFHVHEREGEVMRMREVTGYDVPAGRSFELKPGGAHLMFVELRRAFKEGERVPVTLKFEKAGEVRAELHVGPLGGSAAPAHSH
jgi:copper(I)-binding protein